jgi:hypothetical protein
MAGHWYYAHDDNRIGPCSDRQLRDLADAGQILPTDTIWKAGVEQGVSAAKVKNLFPGADDAALAGVPTTNTYPDAPLPAGGPAHDPLPQAEVAETPTLVPAAELPAQQSVAAPVQRPMVPPQHVRKGRAVAGKGVSIISQDGTYVKLTKKCTVCGHEDPSRATVLIRSGMNKVAFFCPKCKRRRQAEFQGTCH